MQDSTFKSVKDMLKSGSTEEDLRKMFEEQLSAALKDVAAEKEKEKKAKEKKANLDETRKAAIKACYNHMVALGLADTSFTDEDIDDVCKTIEIAEEGLKRYCNGMQALKNIEKTINKKDSKTTNDIDADDIIEDFLKDLGW